MDKSDFMISPSQLGNKMYTLDEALAMMEPIYAEYKITVKKCISGLTDYAAGLASTGQTAPIPGLRQYILEMASFWGLNDDVSKEGYDRLMQEYGGAFDQAVARGKASPHYPALSEQAKADIVAGLQLYAKEMAESGGLEKYVEECHTLEAELKTQWAEQPTQGMTMGGM